MEGDVSRVDGPNRFLSAPVHRAPFALPGSTGLLALTHPALQEAYPRMLEVGPRENQVDRGVHDSLREHASRSAVILPVHIQFFNFRPRPGRAAEKRQAGFDAWVILETANRHALPQLLPPKMADQLGQQVLEGDAVQRIVGCGHPQR